MNTLAHMAVAAAVLARPAAPRRNRAIVLGALAPDAYMFVFFAWSRIQGWSGEETWNIQYWTEPWQLLGAISNSFILFGALLALALWRKWPLLIGGCLAALLHLALDLPLHADDAHRHFWPLTDWRFVSPVSYWDPRANGLIGGAIETVTALTACAILWVRFSSLRTRTVIAGFAVLQLIAFGALLSWVL